MGCSNANHRPGGFLDTQIKGNIMKTKFTTDCAGRVTVSYDDAITGNRVTREFTCPTDGGYVRERMSNGDWTQVCDGLAHRGNTLAAASREKLISLIRSEYRVMRRAEKQFFAG